MKIVINSCYGGFSLSHEAIMLYAKLKGITIYCFDRKQKDYNEPIKLVLVDKPANDLFAHYYTTNPPTEDSYFSCRDFERNDPILVQVVEQLGKKANGRCAYLTIENIADGTAYRIHEYDGMESIEERDQISWDIAKD